MMLPASRQPPEPIVTLEIVSDRILTPDGTLRAGRVLVDDGVIAAVDVDGPAKPPRGSMLLPGIVDLHGDAVEHQLMPRPGVGIPVEIALADTDRQLAANGVTTPFLSLTCSWESGLRSADTVSRMLDALDRLRDQLAVDHRIHLRFETMALDTVAMAVGWIESGRIDLVSINDHFPGLNAARDKPAEVEPLAKRSGLDHDSYRALLDSLAARRSEMDGAVAAIIAASQGAGVTLASHDDRTAEERRAKRALGCTLADFPTSEAAIREAHSTGDPVVMGAPNVLRGGTHIKRGGASAAAMVEAGFCTVLASDYFYPALAPAALRLWSDHGIDTAWGFISSAPAAAVGLTDRGVIAEGMRADLVLVEPAESGFAVRTLATVAGGHAIVHHRDGTAAFTERSSPVRRVVAAAT
jgi:alpha-D-ribose 1-methylphosphonate 5-triphosphate diphosphatase